MTGTKTVVKNMMGFFQMVLRKVAISETVNVSKAEEQEVFHGAHGALEHRPLKPVSFYIRPQRP